MAMNKRSRAATTSLTLLAVTGGILVLLNVLGVFWYGRADLTENQAYSLSQGSRRVAASLEDQMKVTAYFTEDLPPPFNATERYVRDMLAEYEAASGGDIAVRIVHPDTPEEQQEAEEAGVQKVRHQAVEDDSVNVVEGYRGLVVRYLGDKKAIPAIQGTEGLEYTITMAMKELVGDKRPIGVLQGHGEPTLEQQGGMSKLQALLPLYELKTVSAEEPLDDSLAALLVVNPKQEISQQELLHIDQYLMKGGSLGLFGGAMQVDLQSLQSIAATGVTTGVNSLIGAWGVKLRSDIVADPQCRNMPMQSQMGLPVRVPYPPLPMVTFDEEEREHPVLFRLPAAVFPFSSSLEVTDPGDDQVAVDQLAASSDNAWRLTGASIELQPRMPQQWRPSREVGSFPLLAAIEGKLPSAFADTTAMSSPEQAERPEPELTRATEMARVLVFGTGTLLQDQFVPSPEQLQSAATNSGIAIVLNAIDWLAQDSDLIAVRAKNVADPSLEVPQLVQQAKQEAAQAKAKAQAANQKGDRQGAEEAIEEQEEALEERQEILASWKAKKQAYRWGNTLGLPALLALFGVARWRLRTAKKERLKI